MPEPKTELVNIDWRETSFVPAGDNEPARIVMWKNEPELTDEEIHAILAETATEKGRQEVTTTLTKKDDVQAVVTRLAKERYPNVPEAAGRARIWAERPDLREAHEASPAPQTPAVDHETPASLEKGAPALAKRDAAVAELRKVYPDKSRAELRVMALQENPEIYDEYRRLSAS